MTTQVTVDGQIIDAGTAAAAKLIEDLQGRIANDNQAGQSRHAELAEKDRQISETTAHIDQLRLHADDQGKLIIQLGDLKALCSARLKVDPVGRTVPDMKRDALSKKLGPQAVAGKDDAYVAARFDITLDSSAMAAPAPDPFREALRSGAVRTADANSPEAAHQQMTDRIRDAWKNPGAGSGGFH